MTIIGSSIPFFALNTVFILSGSFIPNQNQDIIIMALALSVNICNMIVLLCDWVRGKIRNVIKAHTHTWGTKCYNNGVSLPFL